jgi:hypothetical protein
MDGKEYFSHYITRMPNSAPFHSNDSLHAQAMHAPLARKLFHLYAQDEIKKLLADGTEIQTPKLAEMSIEGVRALQQVTRTLSPYYDSMDHIDPNEKSIHQQRLEISTQMSSISDYALSYCVSRISNIHNPNQLAPEGISKRVCEAISVSRKQSLESIKDWRISLSEYHHKFRNTDIDHFFVADNSSAARKLSVEQDTRLDEHDDDVLRTISVLHEIELFLALNHWVKERGLPYLPVFAPMQLEAGRLADAQDNPHADLFLCCMMPNQNDIIPIQVKKGRRKEDVDRYIDGMVVWANQDTYQITHDNVIGK